MPRKNTFNTFLAVAAGAATTVTAIEYTRQRRAALAKLGQDSQLIDTALGPAEIGISGDGPAVLAVHGALAGYDQGLLVGKSLAEAGYRVIAVSRPGYLRTSPIKDMAFAGQGDFLAAVLDALKIKQAIILGLSAGGPSAIQLAARHPDRCRALILMCAISHQDVIDPDNATTSAWLFDNLMQSDFLSWLGIQATLKSLPLVALSEPEGWRARIMEDPQRRALFEKLMWSLFPSSPRLQGALSDRALVAEMKDLPLKKVSAPTLVLHGTADSLVPFEHGENSAKRIAGARFVPIDGGDHALFVSHDDLIWPEVLAFLQRLETTPKRAASRKSPARKKPAARKPSTRKAKPEPKPKATRTRRTPSSARPSGGTTSPRRRRPRPSGET